MRHAYVVTWGTRSCIVAASGPENARHRVVTELKSNGVSLAQRGFTADDVTVRDAEARDWRTLDYYGGPIAERQRVAEAMHADQLTA